MAEWKKTAYGFMTLVASLVIVAFVSAAASHGGQAASGDTAETGELLIRGEQIKRLILRDGKGEQRVLSEPGSRVVLPVGEYRLHEVTLQGDHSCQLGPFPADGRLTVDPNIPATLKVGAPLRQVIEVKRQGSIMGLTYELIGQGGERYSINREQNSPAPSFAVYKGNRKVASGDFEFG